MASKVAITVDSALLEKIESLRRGTKESRSAVFARAARLLLGAEERKRKIQRYVEAYREVPESEAEIDQAHTLAVAALRGVEWEE
jgi:metal-responsive CopG/Arc/MetJ family transcriptional regulator